jgi:peroxisomal membrane protein 4
MSDKFLLDHIVSVLRGLRNGIYYGGKVRLVHAFVMMLLFKTISKSEIKNIFKLGYEHARNLGIFVFSYKALCIILAKIWGEKPVNHFISGFIFGFFVFGKKTPVNI